MENTEILEGPRRVLVVEDEALIRLVIAEQLADAGLDVIEAGNAAEGQSHLDTGTAVDLVFTDIRMPGAMDGLDFARHVRSRFPAMPIVITSGLGHRADAEGIGVFLPKPYDFSAAAAVILQTLGLS